MNEETVNNARRAVEAHEFTEKDVKKLKKKIRSLRRSRVPGSNLVAAQIQRVLDDKTLDESA